MATIEDSKSQHIPQLHGSVDRPACHNPDLAWDVLTMLVWLGIASQLLIFLTIYFNPHSSLNPFSPVPPTIVAGIVLPSATPSLPPTATIEPTLTITVLATATIETPTATSQPDPTQTETPGPSPTPTVVSRYPFALRNEPFVIAGSAIPDHDTCKLWAAGQSYDLQNAPMVGVTVMLGGVLNGRNVYQLSLTGTALQFGQAGYEFVIAEQPVKSTGSVWVQLFDQALVPLSGRIHFDTFDNCDQNLILINFKQVR